MKASRLRRRQQRRDPVKWTPLARAALVPLSEAEIRSRIEATRRDFPNITEATVRATLAEVQQDTVWRNDLYQVHVRDIAATSAGMPRMVCLSARRLDRGPLNDWRHMQRIKNQLVGPECEGVELYPAESRLIDTANQRFLWVVADPTFRWPFGFNQGRHVSSESTGGAVQRPIEDDNAP
jgi:hypothetical protein